MKWVTAELHTHTCASDGNFTFEELVQSAKAEDLDVIAITDHNTIHPATHIRKLEKKYNIDIIAGMEWTTFYGHLVILNLHSYIDWRTIGPSQFDVTDIKKSDAILGIAHPFRVGSPIATGCHWEYEVSDWNDIDYFEVWSNVNPNINAANKKAFKFWLDKLNTTKLTAVYGRDWHRPIPADKIVAKNYIGVIGDNMKSGVIDAIKAGRVVVSLAPLIEFTLFDNDHVVNIGEDYFTSNCIVNFKCVITQLNNIPSSLVIKSNLGPIHFANISQDSIIVSNISITSVKWIIAVIEQNTEMVAFTNPIFIRQKE
ncbi:MAG: hypothetical protein ATN34_01580 [Epulopiscium sp. Nele67-Bin002]|nr:MAG: hypothetical protein BEN18_06745 [Epulopiscium sp. Nuni2H_MBin001]OON92328.1 MAG: hypothetical protein ATN34_01580 [Epulopiscium sp. Nele67-Bin002]